MPNGRVHSIATIISTGIAVGALVYNGMPVEAYHVGIGGIVGLVVTPDLDVDNGSISNYFMRKYFGSVIGWIWKAYWYPYAKIIPHRSRLSHSPIIGTLIRLIYIFSPPIVLIWIYFNVLWMPEFSFILWLIVVDTIHILLDVL